MLASRFLAGLVCLSALVGAPALAADQNWEIERNFRYFKYESDVALQRVGFDLARAALHHAPDVEEMEKFLNDPGFWARAKLSDADPAARKAWPAKWRADPAASVYDLIAMLRHDEGVRAPMPRPDDLARRGWASLLARGTNKAHPDGWTDTCWDSSARLHVNCAALGDYVRPAGWIVRAYDTGAAEGEKCLWSAPGGAFAGELTEDALVASRPRLAPWSSAPRDCREARVFVPSDASDAHKVHGALVVTRTDAHGASAQWSLTPSDTLIAGFADSFGSGEGNPERGAIFDARATIPQIYLPARDTDAATPSGRAQWTDRWCHRSVYSWQNRASLHAALLDPRRSVTVLHYGCSGAQVFQGLLYTYDGVEHTTPRRFPPGHSAQLGVAYQELCKSYYGVARLGGPPAVRPEPSWQADANLLTFRDTPAHRAEVVGYIEKNLTRCEPSGPLAHAFKRDVDALLLIAGINDIGFSRWATAAIAPDWVSAQLGGFIPRDGDARTDAMRKRLYFRYAMLREALDKHFLIDAGLAGAGGAANGATLSHVVMPLYPRALEDGRTDGGLCVHGNEGMSVGVLPDSLFFGGAGGAKRCEMSFNLKGVVLAVRRPDDLAAIEWFRANRLDGDAQAKDGLAKFAAAASDRPGYTLILEPGLSAAQGNGFAGRGFCATSDPVSRIAGSGICLSLDDLARVPAPWCANVTAGSSAYRDCVAASAESLYVARQYWDPFQGGEDNWLDLWRPYGAEGAADAHAWSLFAPYAHRTRLFRTPDDVMMLINQRPAGWIDTLTPGPLDIARATGGAFHPTAEGHAMIATLVAERLQGALGLPAAP